jgi:hypothetical protein|tara:strand:+ start:152 stop:1054 length:903 start_codon:yes stop_codon:yes gene_type:complete
MALSVTSNFTGKAAGFYISAALKDAKSLEFLTVMENVKFKSNIQKMAGSEVVGNATCDFTKRGTLALTESVLEPKNLQINMDICKLTLLQSWEALQMRAGAGAPPPASFDDYVISYMGSHIANATETSIWGGNDATAGEFTGFNTAAVGRLIGAGATQVSAFGAPFVVGNIVDNLQTIAAAIPSAVYNKEDLYIYMSPKSYRLYISKVSSLGYVNMYNMNGEYEAVFEGIKLAVCPGMLDDELVAAEKSNLFYGTDLLSDATRIDLLDMSTLDGSDNMRMVARYSGGVQSGIATDIVRLS